MKVLHWKDGAPFRRTEKGHVGPGQPCEEIITLLKLTYEVPKTGRPFGAVTVS